MPFRIGSRPQPIHIMRGLTPIKKRYRGSNLIWENSNPPVINSFLANPTSIDLDTPPRELRLSFSITLGTNKAQCYKIPQNTKVGAEYNALNSVNSADFTIEIPNQTQSYRVLATASNGASHRDLTIPVSMNPQLINFRRLGFRQTPGVLGGDFVFGVDLKGYPRPSVDYRFGNGAQGTISARHWHPVSGQVNTWRLNPNPQNPDWRVVHNVLSDSLVLTAGNTSGTVTATINNISA